MYVAFTRPPAGGTQYQITGQASGGVAGGEIGNSIDAQNNGRATLFFNRAPADVTVTMAGLPVAENAVLDVIPFQRTDLNVIPNGDRVYRATVSEQGATLAANELSVTAGANLVTDDVEVSRYYRFDPADNAYDSGIGSVHLPADIDIGVRRFQMRIQNTVPMRATVDQTAAVITNVSPGDTGFILVPAPLAPVAVATAVVGTPSLNPRIDAAAEVPEAAQPFIGDGGVLEVEFLADDPPEEQATVTFTINVGSDAASAVPVECEVQVDPHFLLEVVGGGPFEASRGGSVILRAGDGTQIESTGDIAGITFTSNNDEIEIAVDAGFGPNSVTIQVRDTANNQRQARRILTIV
jgi:hypothetical protein